jgi:hypothetical protein
MMESSPLPSPGKRAEKLLGLFLPCLALALSPGCAGDADAGSTSAGPPTREGNGANATTVGRDVRDLVAALTPMAADAPPVELNEWFLRRSRLLERVRDMGPAWGEEALRVYHDRPSTHPEVLSGLLDVAAHTCPEKTAELLVPLITEFGADLHIRTKACSFLATAAPALALQVLEPLIKDPPRGQTYPPRERMLGAWDEAARKADKDRSNLLCLLATDATNEMDLRHLATRLLGTFKSRQGRQALELLMVESGSNSYVRRLATQSLIKTVPEDELCAQVRKVIEREADVAFQIFLDNVLQENCR